MRTGTEIVNPCIIVESKLNVGSCKRRLIKGQIIFRKRRLVLEVYLGPFRISMMNLFSFDWVINRNLFLQFFIKTDLLQNTANVLSSFKIKRSIVWKYRYYNIPFKT